LAGALIGGAVYALGELFIDYGEDYLIDKSGDLFNYINKHFKEDSGDNTNTLTPAWEN